jgi:hypothetical protein
MWCCVVSAEYDQGYADGIASRDPEVEALQRIADYWYFRANNPGIKTAEQKIVESIIDGIEVNERRRKVREELDAVEAALFDDARGLIAEGLDDATVARKVGLFLPIVANIRAGVL